MQPLSLKQRDSDQAPLYPKPVYYYNDQPLVFYRPEIVASQVLPEVPIEYSPVQEVLPAAQPFWQNPMFSVFCILFLAGLFILAIVLLCTSSPL